MKKHILFIALFVTGCSFAQSVNDYKAVIVPLKYDFMKSDNQYRLATLSKFNLQKAGFDAFYSNESVSKEYNDRCNMLYVNVVKESAFLATKVHIDLNDCNGVAIYTSPSAYTKLKDTELAYVETINKAFESIYALQYKYNNKNGVAVAPVADQAVKETVSELAKPVAVVTPVMTTVASSVGENQSNTLYAQPITNGFQLVDSKPQVVMKVLKTSKKDSYIAVKGAIQGILISKDNQWFFEYYQNDILLSEKVEVKF